jgi:hypothetical protein
MPPSLPTPPDSPNNMKHMQHETLECNVLIKTDETCGTYVCNIYVKHMQHTDKTLAACNIKTLTAYIRLKQLKHLEHIATTYV